MLPLQVLRKIEFSRVNAILHRAGAVALDTIYPPRCLACPEPTDAPHGLCASCWRETYFIAGPSCRMCGAPLIGDDGVAAICDSCIQRPPGWDFGAAAVVYGGAGRRVVLALKHGDRLDMVGPLVGWMETAGRSLLTQADMIAPVPLHWRRLVKRRYNQSAELVRTLAHRSGKQAAVDLLIRRRATAPQEQMNFESRRKNQAGAFEVNSRRAPQVEGKTVLLIDDVLTSGATLSTCAEVLHAASAARVLVLVIARVASDDAALISAKH